MHTNDFPRGIALSFPPPPSDFNPPKTRPSVVTKYATYSAIASILCIVVGIINFFVWGPPGNYFFGSIITILGVIFLIASFAFYAGQCWALTLSGYSRSQWANTPEVRAYFGIATTDPAFPQDDVAAPPPPACPSCGQPLTYIQQYTRWYCTAEQKYQ